MVTAEQIKAHAQEMLTELTPRVGYMKALAMMMAFMEDCRVFYGEFN